MTDSSYELYDETRTLSRPRDPGETTLVASARMKNLLSVAAQKRQPPKHPSKGNQHTLCQVLRNSSPLVDIVDTAMGGVVKRLPAEARVEVVPDKLVAEHKVRSDDGEGQKECRERVERASITSTHGGGDRARCGRGRRGVPAAADARKATRQRRRHWPFQTQTRASWAPRWLTWRLRGWFAARFGLACLSASCLD